ncbi:MAG TPA: hypothetical protein VFS07_08125 [Gemmatimonadales bacterium]|jgi:hypothetical protein|nr:hypothetical protein [Gemmatimonadales bacterium]
MHLTIALGELVQEAVPGRAVRSLVTRPTGAAVRSRVEARLRASEATVCFLDFAALDLIDFSCADEVVAKLLLHSSPTPERYLVLVGLHDHQDEEIDHVLRRQNLAVLAFKDHASRPRLLGAVRDDHREVFDALLDHDGPGDAHALADRLARPVDAVADALAALALFGVVWASDGTYQPLVYSA